jgi:O-acetyl-ADP-ribose deacetylase (regulator of RNase III)
LLGSGSFYRAIHRAAGPKLSKFNRKFDRCETDESKIIPGFNLTAKNILHTVGPVWNGGNNIEDELLGSRYRNSLTLSLENKMLLPLIV